MRLVVQRVTSARVEVDGEVVGAIDRPGLVILAGVTHDDQPAAAERLAEKVWTLRILHGERSCQEENAPILVVSQFTLYADTRKGRRPSWSAAAPRALSEPLIEAFVSSLRIRGAEVATGVFGADMRVSLTNDGPVTLILDSAELSRTAEDNLGDQDGVATPGGRSRLSAGLDGECDVATRLGRDAQLLHSFHSVVQRLLKGGAIGKGPCHLGDPAVLAVALSPARRVYLGVPIHQTDLGDGGFRRKSECDDLANTIAVAPPRRVHLAVRHLFGRVDNRGTGAIGALRRLTADAHLSRRQRRDLSGVRRVRGRSLLRAGLP